MVTDLALFLRWILSFYGLSYLEWGFSFRLSQREGVASDH